MRYIVVYEQTPKNWGAYIPDLPGCVAAADTREEVENLIREAAELYVDTLKEGDEAVPKPGAWTATIEVKASHEPAKA